MTLGTPNLIAFAETLEALAAKDSQITAVTSDSRGSGKLVSFGQNYLNQIIEVGIAEQNLVGVAAGLASTGKKVFAVSPSCFLTARALEQIKNDVCYSDNPVNLIGISAGVSYGALGTTHHSLHDIAVLRTIHNLNIIVPADNFETQEAIKWAAASKEPCFIRFGKKAIHHLHSPASKFVIGKGFTLKSGNDIAFIATGETVEIALAAAAQLMTEGIDASVISMPSIKPFDSDLLIKTAQTHKALITVEEHSIYGGLGELCTGILMQASVQVPIKIVGIPDEYTVTGSQAEILEYYGISTYGLSITAKELLFPI